ncbi:MAG: prepilin-type N-terminal cleavage/methylation domain-containing protein [Parcubacteria group bacterium]
MRRLNSGFSMMELIIVMAIIAIISTLMIVNFRGASRTKTAQKQIASIVLSDIRKMQSFALAGSQYDGNSVCGYGIHYEDQQTYVLYAGRPDGNDCSFADRNYESGWDYIVDTEKLKNNNIEFEDSFFDIFFESPHPITYIDGDIVISPAIMTFRTKDTVCGVDQCTSIVITLAGKLDLNVPE